MLSVEPVIVETPTPLVGQLAPDEALECLLQLCEGIAELHAAGWAHRRLTVDQVGIDTSGARPRVEVSFPSIGPLWLAADDDAAAIVGAVRCDVLQIARLASIWVGPFDAAASSGRVERITRDVDSVASLARAIAAERPDDGWRARAARMPDTRELTPVPTDWDRVISTLDDDMRVVATMQWAEHRLPRYAYTLAGALDQRARLALARRDLAAALADAERAVSVDDDPPYRVTCAVVRLELGDVDAALDHVARALAPPPPPYNGPIEGPPLPPPTTLSGPMRARAHLVRVRAHQLRGDRDAARAELALARAASDEPIVDAFARE